MCMAESRNVRMTFLDFLGPEQGSCCLVLVQSLVGGAGLTHWKLFQKQTLWAHVKCFPLNHYELHHKDNKITVKISGKSDTEITRLFTWKQTHFCWNLSNFEFEKLKRRQINFHLNTIKNNLGLHSVLKLERIYSVTHLSSLFVAPEDIFREKDT